MHKRTLTVSSYHVGSVHPYSAVTMAESRSKLDALAKVDNERMMLDEISNRYESFIYTIKNKLADYEEEVAAVTTEEQREALLKSAVDGEMWMEDEGYDASFDTYTLKYEELYAPADKVFFRMKEVSARAEAIKDLNGKLKKVEALMKKWETTMPQVTEEERAEVLSKVEDVRKWVTENTEAQAAADPTSDAVFTSDQVPLQTLEVQKVISKLSRKPKPVPKKEEKKNETDADADKKNETDADAETKEGEEEAANEGEDKDDATEEAAQEEGANTTEESEEDEL